MGYYLRPGNSLDVEHSRRTAFERYDTLVSEVLSDLKSALFPHAYYVHKVEDGKWYLSPPKHSMRMHPVEVRLRFDTRNRPIAFQVINYLSWTAPVECELSYAALSKAVEKLFPRLAGPSAGPTGSEGEGSAQALDRAG